MQGKGRLAFIFEEGYEQGWSDGYDAAVSYLINNDTAYERLKSKLWKEQIA